MDKFSTIKSNNKMAIIGINMKKKIIGIKIETTRKGYKYPEKKAWK